METLIAPAFNLAVLIGILVYKLRKPLIDFVANRHHSIRTEIQNVRLQLQDAQTKYDEFSAKLKAIDAEVSGLREQLKQDMNAMRLKISTESQQLASVIVSDANKASRSLVSDLKNQLYMEFVQQILGRTETILKARLTGDDLARIRREFSHQVEKIQ